MNEIPPPRDTVPPEAGEDFKHHSTLPPFASEESVQELKDKFIEVNALLGEMKNILVTLTNRVASFDDDIQRVSRRGNRLAARMTILDGEVEEEEGHNGHG
jgi:chromosome segregation ATPase